VPTPAPEAVAHQPTVAKTADTITLLPISPRGAVIGRDYRYVMPHCGEVDQIDVDGSFWDPTGTPATGGLGGLVGVFRLTAPDRATFTAPSVGVLPLVRHDGPKTFSYCA